LWQKQSQCSNGLINESSREHRAAQDQHLYELGPKVKIPNSVLFPLCFQERYVVEDCNLSVVFIDNAKMVS
jgi:hypothetical protein